MSGPDLTDAQISLIRNALTLLRITEIQSTNGNAAFSNLDFMQKSVEEGKSRIAEIDKLLSLLGHKEGEGWVTF